MLIGTAGHIDHGKTSLVKALTGVDTDRLKEEKARGISIELGYAYHALPGGGTLGFIDVPGHERFIHHMLAGATGIDYALLVVAADDGVMPQTREHLDILGILGVAQGSVALTKIDRVGPERVAEVGREIQALLAGGPLAAAPLLAVSAQTGDGIESLRNHLESEAVRYQARKPRGGFRLAVDRCFTLAGAGTVVTGTAFSGSVRVGDELIASPSGRKVRVRSIHVQNRPAEQGSAGDRCALNLAGVAKEDVQRGQWVLGKELHAPSYRFDARLRLLPGTQRALKHWTPVHLHFAAADVSARIALLDTDSVAPGGTALVQLVLSSPHCACHGDVFVVRDQSAVHTMGGGTILDPDAPARRRRVPERLTALTSMEGAAPLASLLGNAPQGVDLNRLSRVLNIDPDALVSQVPSLRRIRSTEIDFAFSPETWEGWKTRVQQGLTEYHAKYADELGPDASRTRRSWLPQLAPPVCTALLEEMAVEKRIARSGAYLHLPGHRVSFTPAEERLAQRLLPLVDAGGFDPMWVRELAKKSGAGEAVVRTLLIRLAKRGDVFQVVKDLFFSRRAMLELASIAEQVESADGEVRAAAFRDRVGFGRKRAIQILEFFDHIGYTRRVRDAHQLRSDSLILRKGLASGGAAGLQTR